MRAYRLFPFIAVALVILQGRFEVRAQGQPQDPVAQPSGQPKLIKSPVAPIPEPARKKNIEGRVALSIVVDEKGRVADAKVLSGPPELYQAAIDSVKQWEFEPPAHPPMEIKTEISFGYPRECPGPISDAGEVMSGGWIRSKRGTVISERFDADQPLPPYFTEDRKAGISGEMRLAISVLRDGTPTNVGMVKSLSPHLDKAAMDTVRQWRFKLIKGSPDALPDDFELAITYRAVCRPQF